MKSQFLLIAAFLAMLPLSFSVAGDAQPPAVAVASVSAIDASEPKTYIGTVAGADAVDIVARVSGTLWTVAFEEGGVVNKGDVLFEIEDHIYRATVHAAQAQVKQAEANLELAHKEHTRNTNLLNSNAISAQTFDNTDATVALREAQLDEAEANLALKTIDLEYCRIKAPMSGRIGEKKFSEGNYITPASGTLATIVQYQPVKVRFSMSESDYFRHFTNHNQLRDSEIAVIRANGERYTGVNIVDYVDNSVDRKTDTIMISLLCDNPEDQLLPGGFVEVRVAEKYGAPTPAVPLAAVMTDGTNHYVYVVDNDDVVQRREIRAGDVVGRHQTVVSGLRPGERVVSGGMNKTAPGMKIRPVAAE